MTDLLLLRTLVVALLTASAYFLRPFQLPAVPAALVGLCVGLAAVLAESRLRSMPLARLLGAALGAVLGLLAASLTAVVLRMAMPGSSDTVPFLQLLLLLLLFYGGVAIGAAKGDLLNLSALGGVFAGEAPAERFVKLLDTSVIIDGRIADVAEAGFLDGTVGIPQFVLRELQLVADSADSAKRNRGRRGLDVLQRIQKIGHLHVQILDQDFPNVRDVDLKLLELARALGCKIVTNDFNLNKVAQLHGVSVLNINELANALKPVVLPGEMMRVFILKEGKEYNQGVAYLDDGTMVVVDNARKLIGRTIDVTVTSVLQTTAGKMIFGKVDPTGQHPIVRSAPEQPAKEQSSSATPGP